MRELVVADGPIEAILLPDAGARIHRLRAFGEDLLRTPADPTEHLRDPLFWGAYVMAPWANRIAAAPASFGDRVVQVPANFADGTAIHGQVASRPWTLDAGAATFRVRAGDDGWPWAYEVELGAVAAGGALRIGLSLTNRSDEAMPAGLGLHPWWRRPVEVTVHAAAVYASNTQPADHPQPVDGAFDLRALAQPARGLDATWAGVTGSVELAWPTLGVAASLRLSGAADHVAVATPDDPDATALEVQTHAPHGLERLLSGAPGGLRLLSPGETLEMGLELNVRRTR